jgi:hypothetical protein
MQVRTGSLIGTTKKGIRVVLLNGKDPSNVKKNITIYNKGRYYGNGIRVVFLNEKGAKIKAFNHPIFVRTNKYNYPNNGGINFYNRNFGLFGPGNVKGLKYKKRNENFVREVLSQRNNWSTYIPISQSWINGK